MAIPRHTIESVWGKLYGENILEPTISSFSMANIVCKKRDYHRKDYFKDRLM